MEFFEELKRDYLLEGLDDWITLYSIVDEFDYEYKKNQSFEEIKNKVLNFINYLLETGYFKVKSLDCSSDSLNKNLPCNEILQKIGEAIDQGIDADMLWCIEFDLTDKGMEEAKKYLKKTVDLRIRTLKSARNQFLPLNEVINFIKEEFNTEDNEEIEYEILGIIPYLEDHDMIDKFLQFNNELINWEINSTDFREKIKNEFSKYKEILFFKNTKKGNEILEKYEKFGGDIHEYSWQYKRK